MRSKNRKHDELRDVEMQMGYSKHAEGSCLIKMGDTVVLCTASLEDRVPPFLRNTGQGWLTAEYGMLPRSTGTRMQSTSSAATTTTSALDLRALGEKQIIIDCDVIQADGGTRTASITGGYMALCEAIKKSMNSGILRRSPMKSQIVAISCGILDGQALLDLDYSEDSNADIDANFVFDTSCNFIEIQSSAEKKSFNNDQLNEILKIAKIGAQNLLIKQREVLKINM